MTETIRAAQDRVMANVRAKGLEDDRMPLMFDLLYGEVAEAFDAWRKDTGGLADELADAVIYLLNIGDLAGIDMQDAINAKMVKNEARTYRHLANGVMVKTDEAGA